MVIKRTLGLGAEFSFRSGSDRLLLVRKRESFLKPVSLAAAELVLVFPIPATGPWSSYTGQLIVFPSEQAIKSPKSIFVFMGAYGDGDSYYSDSGSNA